MVFRTGPTLATATPTPQCVVLKHNIPYQYHVSVSVLSVCRDRVTHCIVRKPTLRTSAQVIIVCVFGLEPYQLCTMTENLDEATRSHQHIYTHNTNINIYKSNHMACWLLVYLYNLLVEEFKHKALHWWAKHQKAELYFC